MYNTNELIQLYLQHCRLEKGLNPKTLKAYQIDLTQFLQFADSKISTWDRTLIQKYLAHLHSKYKIKSIKRKIASVKALFTYLSAEGYVQESPFDRIRIKLHEPFILPQTIPLCTIDLILREAYAKKESQIEICSYKYKCCVRDIAVLEILFATGVRVSELCSLQYSSINLNEGTIKIYGKGAKERIIQVSNPDVIAAINAYYKAFSTQIQNTGYFFVNRLGRQLSDQSVRNMIGRYVSLSGINQHITPHMFRHSFATLLLEEDVDIRYIQQLLGHSSITTTQIYTHVTSKKQRDILTAKHPRNKITL